MSTYKIGLTLVALTLLGTTACSEEVDMLTNGKGARNKDGATEGAPCTSNEQCQSGTCDVEAKTCLAASVESALQCNAKPEGTRSYKLFDGTKLEEKRANEGVAINRARVKPYAVMASEYQRVLGNTPETIKTAGGSFDAAPARWFAEATYSGVSMNAVFNISYEGCLTYARASADLKSAPTADSAKTECSKLMRKAWSKTPTPAEVDSCVELATKKTEAEADAGRRWAYVCATVLSSSQFLTF